MWRGTGTVRLAAAVVVHSIASYRRKRTILTQIHSEKGTSAFGKLVNQVLLVGLQIVSGEVERVRERGARLSLDLFSPRHVLNLSVGVVAADRVLLALVEWRAM